MKGKCAGCKVCKAYLRETGGDKEEILIEGKNPALTPFAERVVTAGLLAAEKLLQTTEENSGCPKA